MECIFCDIAQKKSRAKIIHEANNYIAIENIDPQAPVHIVIIPKIHIEKVDAINGKIPGFWNEIILFANEVINKLGLNETGYRIINNGAGYQGIDHEHLHLIGGRGWRPKDKL